MNRRQLVSTVAAAAVGAVVGAVGVSLYSQHIERQTKARVERLAQGRRSSRHTELADRLRARGVNVDWDRRAREAGLPRRLLTGHLQNILPLDEEALYVGRVVDTIVMPRSRQLLVFDLDLYAHGLRGYNIDVRFMLLCEGSQVEVIVATAEQQSLPARWAVVAHLLPAEPEREDLPSEALAERRLTFHGVCASIERLPG